MKFRLIHQQTPNSAQSPVRVVEQTSGRGVSWINRYLDREYVRRLANTSLRTYAHNLLHFVRWWESIHYTGDIREGDLTESTLLDYVRFQSSQQPRSSPSTINDRVAVADRAIRNEFPNAPCQIARGFHQAFLQRKPMGHRRLDVTARATVRRSIGFESRRRVAFRSTASCSWQRQQISLPTVGARNRAIARTLSALGTTQSLLCSTLCLTQRTRARNTHDRCGITILIPLPPPGHRHPARQPSSISTHLCLRHDPRRYEPACAHAADGARGYPDHAALCAGHPTRRLP